MSSIASLLLVLGLLAGMGAPGLPADAGPILAQQTGAAVPHPQAPTREFGWPLSPVPPVIHPFRAPPQRWAAGHRGVDLGGRAGQEVLAAGDGVVSHSGVIAGRGTVTVTHRDGRRTTYEPLDDRLPTGSAVHRGARLGRLATGGSHCGPLACLHWGLVVGPRVYRDPLTLLRSGRIILLPVR